MGYAETDGCRRRVVLEHFGDPTEPSVEGAACCDVCAVRARMADAPEEVPEWDALPMHSRIALGLLDAVLRLRWPVGRKTMAKILAGSRAKGMDRYENHPYFGRLGMISLDDVDALYKGLLLKGYLRSQQGGSAATSSRSSRWRRSGGRRSSIARPSTWAARAGGEARAAPLAARRTGAPPTMRL